MKRTLFTLIPVVLLLASFRMSAQTAVNIQPDRSRCAGDTLHVPLYITGNNIYTMNLYISYDHSLLLPHTTPYTAIHPSFTVTAYNATYNSSTLAITLQATGTTGINFTGQKAADLVFILAGSGSTAMHLRTSPDPAPVCAIFNSGGSQILPVTYTDNNITVLPVFSAGTAASSQSICPNTVPAMLTATNPSGGSTPYSYQWQSSTDNVSFSNIPGASALTYQPGALTSSTYYRQVQSSSGGCLPVNTNPVTITVYSAMSAGNASANQNLCTGSIPVPINASLPSGGSGSFSFNWQKLSETAWSNIPGATSMTYDPGPLTSTTVFRQKQVDLLCGGNQPVTVFTNEVTITVTDPLLPGTASASQDICYNTIPALLSATPPTGGFTPYSFLWQSSTDNTVFYDIPGATSLTYQPGALTASTWFRVAQTSSGGCGTVFTNAVKITVAPQLVVGTAGPSQTICYNTTPGLLTGTPPTGGMTPYTYVWRISYNGSIFQDIPGATDLTYQPGVLTTTTWYKLRQFSAGGCGYVTSAAVTITVSPPMAAGTAAADQTICHGGVPSPLNATPPSGGSGSFAFNWQQFTPTAWVDIPGATSMTYAPGPLTATTLFRQNQVDLLCGGNQPVTVFTNEVTITVTDPLLPGTASASQDVCYNTIPALLSATPPTGGVTPYSYLWQSSTDNTVFSDIPGATSLTYQPSALTTTTWYRLAQSSSGSCGTVFTNAVKITVAPQLIVGTAGPSQTICYNTAPALLTGTPPTGGMTPYTYLWRISYNGSIFQDIPGATDLTYQPGVLTTTTWYKLRQFSAGGCGYVTSAAVTITVRPPMAAGTAAADQTICHGGVPSPLNATPPSGGSGSFAFNWQQLTPTAWIDIPGATSMTYAPGPLTATTLFRQKQVDLLCGGNQPVTVFTNEVTITVTDPLLPGTASASQDICYNTIPALLSATPPTGGFTPYSYLWQSSTDNTVFSDIPGATSLTYQPGALTTTTWYRLAQSSSGGCGTVFTDTLKITVAPQLIVGTAGPSQTICYNTPPALLTGTPPTGGMTPYTYIWRISYNGSIFQDIPGATDLTYQPGVLTTTTWYKLRQFSAGGCGYVTSAAVTITVRPPMSAGTVAADQTICHGGVSSPLSATPPSGGSGTFAFNWQQMTPTAWVDIPGATSLTYAPGPLTSTTLFRQKQVDLLCGGNQPVTVFTNEVTITVTDPLLPGTASASQDICHNTVPALLSATPPTGGFIPYSYLWQSSTDNTVFSDIPGATSLTYQPSALTATTWYRLAQSSSGDCGTVFTNAVKITVAPQLIVGTAGPSQTICYNTAPALLTGTPPTGGMTPYTYIWRISYNGSIFQDIPGATDLTYQPGVLTTTTWYKLRQFSAGGCGHVTSAAVTITVLPPFIPGTASSSQTICYNFIPALLTASPPSGGSAPYGYQWQLSTDGQLYQDIQGATGAAYQSAALLSTTHFRCKQISAYECEPVFTNAVTITVIPQLIAGSAAADQFLCPGEYPDTITATPPTGGVTPYAYQWQNSTDNLVFSDIPGASTMTWLPSFTPGTIYYRQKQTSSENCGQVFTNSVNISIAEPFIPGTIASDQQICFHAVPSQLYSTLPSGGLSPYLYQWQQSADGVVFNNISGATNAGYQPGPLSSTTHYRLNQYSSYGCGSGFTNIVVVTVAAPFTAGTASMDQDICYNTVPALLSATPPTGGFTPYSYLWQRSTDNAVFSDIPGESSLTYQPGTLTTTTWYRLAQSSSGGCGTVFTDTLKITVAPQLIVGTAGPSQTICYNTPPALLTGTPPTGGMTPYTYIWRISYNGSIFQDIPGATDLTYQPGVLTTTTWYKLRQFSAGGCGYVTSAAVMIRVYDQFTAGTISGAQTICAGTAPVLLTGTAPAGGNTPYGYQWQESTDGLNFSIIPNATNLSFQPGILFTDTWYRLEQQSSSGCGIVTTNVLKITVNPTPAPVITSVSDPRDTVCPYSGGHTYSTITGMTSYVWLPGGPGSTVIESGQGTSQVSLFWGGPGPETGTLQVSATNQYGCTGTSAQKQIHITPPLAAGTVAASQTIEYATIPVPLTCTTPSGGLDPYTYQWQQSTDGNSFTDISGATDLGYAPGTLFISTWYRMIQESSGGCDPVTTNAIKITVNPPYITITSPVGGEEWLQGSTHSITWNDNIPDNVSIDLLKGGVVLENLASSVASSGSWTWNIPMNQTPGSDYRIRITSVASSAVTDQSPGDFTVVSRVPVERTIQNLVIINGQDTCFDALQTIYVAGGGSFFTVQPGGSATMIAGQRILYRTGTRVFAGGYMHGYITTSNMFCGSLPPAMVATVTATENIREEEKPTVRVFPNPNAGSFTLQVNGAGISGKGADWSLLNLFGKAVMKGTIDDSGSYRISTEALPSGIYLLRVKWNGGQQTLKIIRN